MNNLHSILMVAIIALVTIALRFLPFLIFNGKRKTPESILYLGKVLPYAIMGMLVIFCFKGTTFLSYPYGIPVVLAGLVVVLLHVWKRNTLLSILGGTILYMNLV